MQSRMQFTLAGQRVVTLNTCIRDRDQNGIIDILHAPWIGNKSREPVATCKISLARSLFRASYEEQFGPDKLSVVYNFRTGRIFWAQF